MGNWNWSNNLPLPQQGNKKKRTRTAFRTNQLLALEEEFRLNNFLDANRRRQVAATLHLSERTVKVWFQNRRMKRKKEGAADHNSTVEIYNNSLRYYDTDSLKIDVPVPVYELSSGNDPTTAPAARGPSYEYGDRLTYHNISSPVQPVAMLPKFSNVTVIPVANQYDQASGVSTTTYLHELTPQQSVVPGPAHFAQSSVFSATTQSELSLCQPEPCYSDQFRQTIHVGPSGQDIELPSAYVNGYRQVEPYIPAVPVFNPRQFRELPPAPLTQPRQENMEGSEETQQSSGIKWSKFLFPCDSDERFS